MSEMQSSPLKARRHDDEIDLVELLRKLWAQKLIIFLAALCGLVSAVGYVYVTPKKFESKVVLAPPSIIAFVPFVRDVKIGSDSTVDLLGAALNLSDNVMRLLGRRLLAPTTFTNFISENPEFSGCVGVSSQGGNNFFVSVTCEDEKNSLLALDGYIEYTSKITTQEFQALMTVVGVESSIEARELYSFESPPSIKVTPKRNPILALGLLLGGVLGLFVVLVRSVLEKLASQGF